MQLEMIILSKSERERQTPYDTTYMWKLQYHIKECIYETETESQIQRTDWWLPGCGGWGLRGGWSGRLGLAVSLHVQSESIRSYCTAQRTISNIL